jgi:hypothetical protein
MSFESQLEQFQKEHSLPGLQQQRARQRLSTKLMESKAWHQALKKKQGKGQTDPALECFNPVLAIHGFIDKGNKDEACWLAFLSIQFGWDNRDLHGTGELIRRFYGRLGHKDAWLWPLVAQNPHDVSNWLADNLAAFRGLYFGNHRKYQTLRSDSKQAGTGAVIEDFVNWVKKSGCSSPFEALRQLRLGCDSDEKGFEHIFTKLKIKQWGRTAKFDFPVLLSHLGLLSVRPAHCYLAGSTGPRKGALLLCTGDRVGRLTAEVKRTVEQLRACLGVPAEVMEDALCNWQKAI